MNWREEIDRSTGMERLEAELGPVDGSLWRHLLAMDSETLDELVALIRRAVVRARESDQDPAKGS